MSPFCKAVIPNSGPGEPPMLHILDVFLIKDTWFNSSAHVIISLRSKMHQIVYNIFPASHLIQVHLNKLECRGKVNLFQ